MPYIRRKYRRRPRIGRKARKTNYRKKSLLKSRPFKVAVKRVINRYAENKFWQKQPVQNYTLPAAITGPTSATSVNPYCVNLLPEISQGTGNSGRIGNQISIVKNTIKGYINLLPYDATTNLGLAPVAVKIYIFSVKNFTQFTGDMGYANWTQFFRVNNSDTGFYGSMLDMLQTVNTDLYTLHTTRTFQLSNNYVQVGSAAVIRSPSGVVSQKFSIDLTKYVKALKYDDNSSLRPTNKSLCMAVQVCSANGVTNSYTVGQQDQLAEIHYIQECEYQDI